MCKSDADGGWYESGWPDPAVDSVASQEARRRLIRNSLEIPARQQLVSEVFEEKLDQSGIVYCVQEDREKGWQCRIADIGSRSRSHVGGGSARNAIFWPRHPSRAIAIRIPKRKARALIRPCLISVLFCLTTLPLPATYKSTFTILSAYFLSRSSALPQTPTIQSIAQKSDNGNVVYCFWISPIAVYVTDCYLRFVRRTKLGMSEHENHEPRTPR